MWETGASETEGGVLLEAAAAAEEEDSFRRGIQHLTSVSVLSASHFLVCNVVVVAPNRPKFGTAPQLFSTLVVTRVFCFLHVHRGHITMRFRSALKRLCFFVFVLLCAVELCTVVHHVFAGAVRLIYMIISYAICLCSWSSHISPFRLLYLYTTRIPHVCGSRSSRLSSLHFRYTFSSRVFRSHTVVSPSLWIDRHTRS